MELTKLTVRIPKSLKRKLLADAKNNNSSIQSHVTRRLTETPIELTREGWDLYAKVQNKARLQLAKAVADGVVIKSPCTVCGNKKSYGHHDDYDKPLEVMWLCAKHHNARHKELQRLGADTWRGMKKYGIKTFFK